MYEDLSRRKRREEVVIALAKVRKKYTRLLRRYTHCPNCNLKIISEFNKFHVCKKPRESKRDKKVKVKRHNAKEHSRNVEADTMILERKHQQIKAKMDLIDDSVVKKVIEEQATMELLRRELEFDHFENYKYITHFKYLNIYTLTPKF